MNNVSNKFCNKFTEGRQFANAVGIVKEWHSTEIVFAVLKVIGSNRDKIENQ